MWGFRAEGLGVYLCAVGSRGLGGFCSLGVLELRVEGRKLHWAQKTILYFRGFCMPGLVWGLAVRVAKYRVQPWG